MDASTVPTPRARRILRMEEMMETEDSASDHGRFCSTECKADCNGSGVIVKSQHPVVRSLLSPSHLIPHAAAPEDHSQVNCDKLATARETSTPNDSQ